MVLELGSDGYIDKQDYIIFKTICHNKNAEDASYKLYYYKNSHNFVCYTDCGDTFNIFELFKRRYEILEISYNFYKDIVLKIAGNSYNKYLINQDSFLNPYESNSYLFQKQKANIEYKIYNDCVLNCFAFNPRPEWLEDGISEAAMRKFNILFSPTQNKIIIPHYDVNSNLIGIRGRALNEEDILIGKYMPIEIEGTIYSHPLSYNLYGLNVVKDNISKLKMAIIAEGEKSSLQSETMFGDKNVCVAACGSNIHKHQLDLLKQLKVEKVLIAFDNEGKKNNKEREKYFNKLFLMCKKYSNMFKMGFIFDTKYLNDKESPFDREKETFLKIYKEAIWV